MCTEDPSLFLSSTTLPTNHVPFSSYYFKRHPERMDQEEAKVSTEDKATPQPRFLEDLQFYLHLVGSDYEALRTTIKRYAATQAIFSFVRRVTVRR